MVQIHVWLTGQSSCQSEPQVSNFFQTFQVPAWASSGAATHRPQGITPSISLPCNQRAVFADDVQIPCGDWFLPTWSYVSSLISVVVQLFSPAAYTQSHAAAWMRCPSVSLSLPACLIPCVIIEKVNVPLCYLSQNNSDYFFNNDKVYTGLCLKESLNLPVVCKKFGNDVIAIHCPVFPHRLIFPIFQATETCISKMLL